MAATASHRRWRDRGGETSPERTKVWAEPPPLRRVPVIYYISRNGQLEHPHFMEVPLSSPEGLFLKDVIERLNFLRGKGMASLYSWSSKRSYKHGFVWHDLSENDFVFPAHGNEYILKGSVILEDSSAAAAAAAALTAAKPEETVTANSSAAKSPAAGDQEFPPAKPHRRRNQSWSSFDSHEYKVYAGEHVSRASAADAATQTDDKRRHRRRAIREIEEEAEAAEIHRQSTTDEISEISPPPTDSSPETLETLMKADGKLVLRPEISAGDDSSGAAAGKSTTKAASVLMQLISCGSIGFRDCAPGGGGHGKENGFSLISHYKVRLPRGGHGGSNQVGKDSSESDSTAGSTASGFGGRRGGGVKLEEKEYFSGSLVELETKRNDFPELKRSSSYNADRSSSSQLEVAEVQETNEGGGITKRFLLRKAKASNAHRSTKLGRSTSEVSWQ